MTVREKIQMFINGKLAIKVEPHEVENYKLRMFIKRAFPNGLVVPNSFNSKTYFIESNLNNNNGNTSVFYCWNSVKETKLDFITMDEFKMDCWGWFLDENGKQIVIQHEA